MRILLGSAHPYLPQIAGGAQSSAHELAGALRAKGHAVAVLAGLTAAGWRGWQSRVRLKLARGRLARDTALGYPVYRGWFPEECAHEVAERENPDVAVLLSGRPVPLAVSLRAAGVPPILYFRNVDTDDFGGNLASVGATPSVANSSFTAGRIAEISTLRPTVVHPLFRRERYETETSRRAVTFINPHPQKGLDLALDIARACPDIPFIFVEAWTLEPGMRRALQTACDGLPNVELWPRTDDMRQVYRETGVLLAPSQWEEAYGRVASEAQMSGIPVIASRIGGLPEAVGPGGVLVAPDAPVDDWVAALRALWCDTDRYAAVSAAALAYADRPALDPEHQIDCLLDLFRNAASEGRPTGAAAGRGKAPPQA